MTGVCRFCLCSDFDACVVDHGHDGIDPVVCRWVDREKTLCSFCELPAKAEALALKVHPSIRRVEALADVYHAGFVVGWFGVSARRALGRNPYVRKLGSRFDRGDAWVIGQLAGREAVRVHVGLYGPVVNVRRLEAAKGVGPCKPRQAGARRGPGARPRRERARS